MTTLGERVKTERKAKGWSQAELARRVTRAGYSITQGGIAQIERRGETEPKSIVQLAQALGLSVNWLQSTRGERTAGVTGETASSSACWPAGRRGRRRGSQQRAARPRQQLQVFASAQGGSEGAMTLSSEPVSWLPRDARLEGVPDAYGCFVSGDSMEPAYERGNILLVNPSAQVESGRRRRLHARGQGRDALRADQAPGEGERGSWTVKQYNPAKTFTLSRKEWRKAHLVIGKYNRAS